MITLFSAICFPYMPFTKMSYVLIFICLAILMQIAVNAIKVDKTEDELTDGLYTARIIANTCLFINCILYIILICYLFI